jgi:hypothetical protein
MNFKFFLYLEAMWSYTCSKFWKSHMRPLQPRLGLNFLKRIFAVLMKEAKNLSYCGTSHTNSTKSPLAYQQIVVLFTSAQEYVSTLARHISTLAWHRSRYQHDGTSIH